MQLKKYPASFWKRIKALAGGNIVPICLLVFSLFFTLLWFKSGNLILGAEDGMVFYSPRRAYEGASYVWQKVGTGYLDSSALSRSPFLFVLSLLDGIFKPLIIQALAFQILIFSGVFGVYLVIRQLFKRSDVAAVASIFYFLNLYSMSQVWSRFLLSGMFSWAYLPLFLYFWIKWVKNGKIWLVLIPISSIFYSYAFSAPAHLITIWTPVVIYLAIEFIFNGGAKRIYLVKKAFVGLIVWLLFNLWWLYPLFSLSASAYSDLSSPSLNFESLRGVSVNSSVSEILQLRQSFYFDSEANLETPWGVWFESPPARVASWMTFILVLVGAYSVRKKIKLMLFLLAVFFLGLFISKGTNPPFGYSFYNILFTNFPFLGALRNPYEKFGIVYLFSFCCLFGFGIISLGEKIKPLISRVTLIGLCLVFFCVFLVWPMWTANVFQDYYFSKVPEYYKEANTFMNINQKKSDGRILIIPMLPFHGLRYTWGYRGDESARFIFDKVSVSKNIKAKIFSDKYIQFEQNILANKDYQKNLKELNIEYLVIDNSIDWLAIGAKSPGEFKNIITKDKSIEFLKTVGELEIYRFNDTSGYDLMAVEAGVLPVIKYAEVRPGHYKIHILNSTAPYKLILKQTFHENWRAKISEDELTNHFLIYDYANGWLVDRLGDYTIDVFFELWPWDKAVN